MDKSKRFIISKPVPGGDQWFEVHDTRDNEQLNLVVATIAAWVPHAEVLIETIAADMNAQEQ